LKNLQICNEEYYFFYYIIIYCFNFIEEKSVFFVKFKEK
jgi:hypothetical protein